MNNSSKISSPNIENMASEYNFLHFKNAETVNTEILTDSTISKPNSFLAFLISDFVLITVECILIIGIIIFVMALVGLISVL